MYYILFLSKITHHNQPLSCFNRVKGGCSWFWGGMPAQCTNSVQFTAQFQSSYICKQRIKLSKYKLHFNFISSLLSISTFPASLVITYQAPRCILCFSVSFAQSTTLNGFPIPDRPASSPKLKVSVHCQILVLKLTCGDLFIYSGTQATTRLYLFVDNKRMGGMLESFVDFLGIAFISYSWHHVTFTGNKKIK